MGDNQTDSHLINHKEAIQIFEKFIIELKSIKTVDFDFDQETKFNEGLKKFVETWIINQL